MNYASIDPVLFAWATGLGLHVHARVQGNGGYPESRAVYVSNERGECFQIWVETPTSHGVGVHAGDVETRDDEEFQQDWFVPVSELRAGLDRAIAQVHTWMNR